MPTYGYACERCGPFEAVRPMAEYALTAPCPACSEAAPRALLTVPALGMMDAGRRAAHATNERSAHAPRRASRGHPAGCGCCTTWQKELKAEPAGVKGFPGKRSWMISH